MDILNNWGMVFNDALKNLWWSFIQFAPKLIVAIVLFAVGWAIGALLAKAFEQVFSALKIDKLLASVGVESFFRRAGMNLNSGYFLGQVVKWFVIVVFLMPSLSLVGLNSISDFLSNDVLTFLPKVFIAAFVLIIASLVADGLSKTIATSARGMNVHAAGLMGTVAKYAVWVFAFIIALGQLGVADYYMSVLFTGIIAMFSIGGALAFGLGGKDAAARFLAKVGNEMSHHG
jgi:hypothetical protein